MLRIKVFITIINGEKVTIEVRTIIYGPLNNCPVQNSNRQHSNAVLVARQLL